MMASASWMCPIASSKQVSSFFSPQVLQASSCRTAYRRDCGAPALAAMAADAADVDTGCAERPTLCHPSENRDDGECITR